MKKHTKILMDFFGYSTGDFIPCEICGAKAVDTNHIDARKMGGSKLKDFIENLMSICRVCDQKYADKKQFKKWLLDLHARFMKDQIPFIQRGEPFPPQNCDKEFDFVTD